jgi:ATP-dependent helicase HepA
MSADYRDTIAFTGQTNAKEFSFEISPPRVHSKRVTIKIGQRWISQTEPELGLGTVLKTEDRMVKLFFPATGQTRQYSVETAPLQRVRFRQGDRIQTHADETFAVETIEERDGLLFYAGQGRSVPETDLADTISFRGPEERLLAGQADAPELFDLRHDTLRHQHRRRKSEVRGFAGGRIDLIPHQLFIAHEVTARHAPRVLLADEVGLGKTIEACLIIHRLLLSGRAARVLILVPESLVHQWFVELLRRFNLLFKIFDEERCAAIEQHNPEANPFLEDQVVLCSIDLLARSERRQAQAVAADWDILVVDEAHHLGWAPGQPSSEYRLVEALGMKARGLLLLTATPEQLGPESHFARLRLLDPDRFFDLDQFIQESAHYQQVAAVADKLLKRAKLVPADKEILQRTFAESGEDIAPALTAIEAGDERARAELIEDLLDQHGTGRVMFRNTRAAMTGFPKRIAHVAAVDVLTGDHDMLDRLLIEFTTENSAAASPEWELKNDPRIVWLAGLLREFPHEKFLLICRSRAKVEAIDAALREKIVVKSALFHEGLPLIQRDRNAAWFGEPDGARLLLCSEIGSEGRNFQFAHRMILFDLPLDPELVEQRIGRLDRIGQTSDIHIHVPWVKGSPQEIVGRWYHEGLNAFEQSVHGGYEIGKTFSDRVRELALRSHEGSTQRALEKLIAETKAFHKELAHRLEQGRDRLLELSSFRPEIATQLVGEISQADQDRALDDYMLEVFDHYGVRVEELGPRTFLLGGGDLFTDAFPSIPEHGMVVTCERKKALAREEIGFLTWDHPMVSGAMDLMLGSGHGNSSFAVWEESAAPGLLLETIYLLEGLAPPEWQADRFLPATPIRLVVDHRSEDVTGNYSPEGWKGKLRPGEIFRVLDQPGLKQTLLPNLIEHSRELAGQAAGPLIEGALRRMREQLGHELHRLETLQRVNRNVRPEEIDLAREQIRKLETVLSSPRLRLDAVRLIWRGRQ